MSPVPNADPRRRLFWRIYLHGILLLICVAAAMTVVALVSSSPAPWHRAPQRVAELLDRDLSVGSPDPGRLQRRLDELHGLLGLGLVLLLPDGTRLAAAGDEGGLKVPDRSELRALLHGGETGPRHLGHGLQAVALGPPGERRGLLLVARPWEHDPTRLLAFAAAILVALGLASFPLARAIARPLERLTATARRLAAGELQARTGLSRRDEVGLLADTIDHMAARLEQRVRSERELLANVSHELRTPLSRLRVALELCEEEEDGSRAIRARLAGMVADLDELDGLLQNVLLSARLDLARQTGGQAALVPRPGPLDWIALVGRAAERFARLYPGRELELELSDEPGPLSADAALLKRVLDNLLDNAAKYSPPDRPVTLRSGPASGRWQVEVRDRGAGVDPAELSHLFEPFYRGATTRAAGGVGLGLTLCRRVIEAHGGEIEAGLHPGGGLVVRFWIPQAPQPRPTIRPT